MYFIFHAYNTIIGKPFLLADDIAYCNFDIVPNTANYFIHN